MTLLRTTLLASLTVFAVACGGAKPQQPPTNKPAPNAVDVSIASVTLADDCGTAPTTMPPPRSSMRQKPSTEFADMAAPSAGAMARRRCEQSSVQLRVENGTAAASDISIKKVELLDESGNVLGELTPREPSKWTGDSYQPWDGKVDAAQTLQISYSLSQPAVSDGGTYTVRVTIASAEGDKTLETKKTLEAPASLPPGAVT
ncbi:MAG: hypothetical protein H0T46_26540 [Deltaproteobacteria bacterium]|nr:hypothetical protein [Deltaproteobacteria bacterium]